MPDQKDGATPPSRNRPKYYSNLYDQMQNFLEEDLRRLEWLIPLLNQKQYSKELNPVLLTSGFSVSV